MCQPNQTALTMKNCTLFALAALTMLFVLPSCHKITDFIQQHPGAHDSLCRVTQIGIKGYYNNPDEYIVYYNAKGDPDSLLDNNPVGDIGNSRYFFHYDGQYRLSDYMWAETIASGLPYYAIIWHKFIYVRPDYIVDTTLVYAGDVRKPAPSAADAAYYTIKAFGLDGSERIVQLWSIQEPNEPPHTPVLEKTFTYDANGNQVLSIPGLSYDNGVNVYRTNKVWQFLFSDYSRNNLIKTDSSLTMSYNSFGLPQRLPNLDSYGIRLFDILNTNPTTDISYACALPKGPFVN
jgi:hypothetical protein